MTEQQPIEPVPCGSCGGQIVDTPVGWTHVDRRGVLTGWVCPMPHMTLAFPAEAPGGPQRRLTDIPPTSRHSTPASSYPGF